MPLDKTHVCDHRRSHVTPGLYGCRVKGICTLDDCLRCGSHSDPSQRVDDGLINLLPKPQVIGQGYHRSGWPFVMDALRKINGNSGILFDDFVEQTWIYSSRQEPIRQPWAGIFHHPPNPPQWTRRQDRIDTLRNNPAFAESIQNLKLAVCLSNYLAEWIEANWDVRTAVVRHPTEVPIDKWQPESWLHAKRLLQCGWYLRNTRLIFEVDTMQHRTRLMPQREHNQIHDRSCRHAMENRDEYRAADVLDLPFVDPSGYDFLLARSVVCMEVLDAAANNVTLECLARNTPLIVNQHPAVVEYLGPDYPLYFDDHRQIAGMIEDEALILAGHEYLKAANKSFLDASAFVDGIATAVGAVQ